MDIADWNLCPTDMEKFVGNGRSMDLKYHWQNVNLNDFHFDAHVPLIFYGWKINRVSIPYQVSPTDIAPSIASFMEISMPDNSTGIVIPDLVK